jgi:hypothetical protein
MTANASFAEHVRAHAADRLRSPLLQREFVHCARRHSFFYLRLLPPVLLVVPAAVLLASGLEQPQTFSNITNFCLRFFPAVLLLVMTPLLSASSLAPEKEQGVLPLLFSAPFRPHELVISKFAAAYLQIFALLLSAAPVIAISAYVGGIDVPAEALRVLRVALVAAVACAFGVLASAGAASAVNAVVLTILFTVPLAWGEAAAFAGRSGIWVFASAVGIGITFILYAWGAQGGWWGKALLLAAAPVLAGLCLPVFAGRAAFHIAALCIFSLGASTVCLGLAGRLLAASVAGKPKAPQTQRRARAIPTRGPLPTSRQDPTARFIRALIREGRPGVARAIRLLLALVAIPGALFMCGIPYLVVLGVIAFDVAAAVGRLRQEGQLDPFLTTPISAEEISQAIANTLWRRNSIFLLALVGGKAFSLLMSSFYMTHMFDLSDAAFALRSVHLIHAAATLFLAFYSLRLLVSIALFAGTRSGNIALNTAAALVMLIPPLLLAWVAGLFSSGLFFLFGMELSGENFYDWESFGWILILLAVLASLLIIWVWYSMSKYYHGRFTHVVETRWRGGWPAARPTR